jgi:hypothetical protein
LRAGQETAKRHCKKGAEMMRASVTLHGYEHPAPMAGRMGDRRLPF